MSVSLRGNKFHYRFQLNGKNYSGVCHGCEIPEGAAAKEIAAVKKQALRAEAASRTKVAQNAAELEKAKDDIRKNRTVRALVENTKY